MFKTINKQKCYAVEPDFTGTGKGVGKTLDNL